MIGIVVTRLTSTEQLATYDAWVRGHPQGTLWQSLEWKRYQEALGRKARIYALMEGKQIIASALVVIDRTTFGFSTWDIPRGPLGSRIDHEQLKIENDRNLLERIIADAQKERCLALYLSPPHPLSIIHYPLSIRPSGRHEQPSATRLIDLTLSEEDILRHMKPKGRYNISVAQKHGVEVGKSTDTAALFSLLKQTSRRDKFAIHSEKHYRAFLEHVPGAFLLFATLPPNPEPIAALLGVIWGSKGIYYYGASSYAFRALMAPYALQMAAMRYCKSAGCTSYDLLGIVPPPSLNNRNTGGGIDLRESLSEEGEGGRGDEGHPWQGVSSFKEKFGGEVVIFPPEQQIVLRPVTHALLKMKRRFLG